MRHVSGLCLCFVLAFTFVIPSTANSQSVFLPRGETGISLSGGISGNDDATVVNGSFVGTTHGWFEMGGTIGRVIRPSPNTSYWTYTLAGTVYPLRTDIRITPVTVGLTAAYTGIVTPTNPTYGTRDSHIYSGSVDFYLDAEIAPGSFLQPTGSAIITHTTDPDDTEFTAGVGLSYMSFLSRRRLDQESNRSFHITAAVVFPKGDVPFTFGVQIGISTWQLEKFPPKNVNRK